MKFHIVSSGRNCQHNIEKYYKSIIDQGNYDITIHVYNDSSTDATLDRLRHIQDPRLRVYHNKVQMGAAYCRYTLIKQIKDPNAIIVLVDLDDHLLPNTISTIDQIYQNTDIWLTYGNWINQHGHKNPNICYPESIDLLSSHIPLLLRKIIIHLRIQKRMFIDQFLPEEMRDENHFIFYPKEVVEKKAYRQMNSFLFTHLRTFKRFLFDDIKKKDFQDEKGNWLMAGTDTPFIALLERCAYKNIKTIYQPLYCYIQSTQDTNSENEKARVFTYVKKKKRLTDSY